MIDNYCTKNTVIVLFQRAGGKPMNEKHLFVGEKRSFTPIRRKEKWGE